MSSLSLQDNVGTYELSGESITIVEGYGVRSLSVLAVSGTVTVKGTLKLGTRESDTIDVPVGNPLNISFDFSMDGVTVDASGGEAILIAGR